MNDVRRRIARVLRCVPGLAVVMAAPYAGAWAQATPDARASLHACCPPPRTTVGTLIDTAPGLLREAMNTAALDDLPASWRRYAVRMHHRTGAWRATHEAGSVRTVEVSGEGMRTVRGWRIAGGAGLLRQREDEVTWRNQSQASIPVLYVWADSVGGTFRGDQVALRAAVATPTWTGLSLGVPVALDIGQAARRNDPRPLSRRRAMEVAPAVRLRVGAHQWGLRAHAGATREDLEIGGGLSPEVPVVFRLRGIATFDRTQLISADRTLLGRHYGVHGGWAHHAGRTDAVISGGVRVAQDSARDGIATPVPAGSTRRVRWEAQAAWRQRTVRGGVEFRAEGAQEEARGTDAVFRAVNAVRRTDGVQVGFTWWQGASPVIADWRVDVHGAHTSVAARDVAGEAAWDATRLPVIAAVQRRWTLAPRVMVFTHVGAGYTAVPSQHLTLPRASRITPLFVTHDHAVQAAPAHTGSWRFGLEHGARRELEGAMAGTRTRWSIGWDAAWARVPMGDATRTWGRHHFTFQLDIL